MSESVDTPPIEKTYLPAEASLLATSVVCLPIAGLLAWVAVGIGVPPWLYDFVCNLLLKGRSEPFRHFTTLSFYEEAILTLFSALLFAFGAFRLEALLGLPRLMVTKDGIALTTLFGTKRARWASLGVFEVFRSRNDCRAQADLVGPGVRQSFLFRKTFNIPDSFSTDINVIVQEINAARAQTQGLSVKLAAEDAPSTGRLGTTIALATGAFVGTALLGILVVAHH